MLLDNYFIFKRTDGLEVLSNELGKIKSKSEISRAVRVINHISIEGRNGTLTEDTGSYNNIEISISLINYTENILDKEVIGLIDGRGGELRLSWLNGWFKVKEVNNFIITEEVQGIFNIEITFVCEPFRYLDEETIEIINSDTDIFISGNIETNHITTILGDGDISLFINDEQINFKSVDKYITIDTDRLICYKDNDPANNKMVGEFLKLNSGINNIKWIGNVSSIEINYRGRFLN